MKVFTFSVCFSVRYITDEDHFEQGPSVLEMKCLVDGIIVN